jgi:ParB family chromosome partitioning protein
VKAEFLTLPLAALQESPTNPRSHVDQAALKELIESIKAQGVLVPLLVRATDRVGLQKDGRDGRLYEVVCGSRRHTAAKAVGLEGVPVRVCNFTDEQVMEVQIIENLQRQDVHPLDEAQGYLRLMKSGRYDATGLAAKVGRSETYIHRRLKLCALIEPAQKALWADKINVAQAELIARLQAGDQKKVLDFATTRTNCTTAVLEQWIASNVLLRLREAPFDKADGGSPGAKPGACNECPKRTSAAPLLFPEVGRDDRCTDPGCWQAKIEAHIGRITSEDDAGRPKVLRLSGDYEYAKQTPDGVLGNDKWRVISRKADACEHATKGIIVKGYNLGKLITVCAEPTCKVHHRGGGGYQRSPAELAAEKKRKLQTRIDAEVENRIRAAIAENAGDRMTVQHILLWGQSIAAGLPYDAAKRLCERHELKPLKTKWGGADHGGALANRLDALHEKLPSAVTEMALATMSADHLREAAAEWDIEPAEIRNAVTAELTPKPKPEAKAKAKSKSRGWGASAPESARSRQRTKKKAKAEPACVKCGCTEANACMDVRTGAPCGWVPADQIPEGMEGPLCSACLVAARERTKRDRKKPKPKAKPTWEWPAGKATAKSARKKAGKKQAAPAPDNGDNRGSTEPGKER